jgi:hypothetical protein
MQEFFARFTLENRFQVVQRSENEFDLRIKLRGSDASADETIRAVENDLRNFLGGDILIRIQKVKAIQCEKSGKFRLVKSLIT